MPYYWNIFKFIALLNMLLFCYKTDSLSIKSIACLSGLSELQKLAAMFFYGSLQNEGSW